MHGGKNKGLKNEGALAFSETLNSHGGDEAAEDVFFENGGHQCQNE